MRTIFGALFLGLVLSVVAAAGPAPRAQAQMCVPSPGVTCLGGNLGYDIKGTVGTGLIGAELGFAIPAIIGMKELWPYIVFPVVGGAGGALLGYFVVEQIAKSAELSVAMLAIGMGLVVPTMVLVLARTAYSPEDDPNARSNTSTPPPPAAEDYDAGHGGAPATTGTTPPAAATHSRLERTDPTHLATAGSGLFRLDASGLFMGMPGVGLAPTFTLDEIRENGLSASDQHSSLRVALLSGSF